jgi:glycyl-tRNA synthetase
MEFLYDYNALPFYDEQDIVQRQRFTQAIAAHVKNLLLATNAAWTFHQIEAPCLIPRALVSANYSDQDMWAQACDDATRQLVLKPETTPSTYAWLRQRMAQQAIKPPVCAWQLSKSFRREQDQPTKHCRFKEFYQQEFQCLYTADSHNDYFAQIIRPLAQAFAMEVCCPTRLVVSDRLPAYAEKTWDIEVWNSEKWMEVASISVRTDFPDKARFKNKEVDCKVLEIATSPDRLTYCWNKRLEANHNLTLDSSVVDALN